MSALPSLAAALPPPRIALTRAAAVAAALLCVSALAAPAGVYRWVDPEGRVHFGDRPPLDRDAQALDVPARPEPATAPAASDAERLESQQRLLRAFEEERREREERRAKVEREAAEREYRCAQARDQLRSFREAGYLYDVDKDGNRIVLNEQDRTRAIKDAREAVARWCG